MIDKKNIFQIGEHDIFEFDKLNRKDAVIDLAELLALTQNSLTMSINASWGAGKTSFVQLLQAQLKKVYEVNSIYFSAWEDDFSKEPLISILGELNSYIQKHINQESSSVQEKIKEGWDKTIKSGGKVLKRGLPAFVKGATGGILDCDAGIESAFGAMTESATKELIEKYSQDKEVLVKFKEALAEVLQNISEDKPFIIFVDELDRCRPLYAIELLERIKHVFEIDKLIFVLSIDKTQLAESIKSQYGNIDTDNYLRRFIDLEYELQAPSITDFCNNLCEIYNFSSKIRAKRINGPINYKNMIVYLAESFNFTLREIEHCFIHINIIIQTLPIGLHIKDLTLICTFIFIKLKHKEFYNDLIFLKKSKSELLKYILDNKSLENLTSLESQLAAFIIATNEPELILDEEVELYPDNIQRFLDTYLCEEINNTIKRIEFTDKFNFSTHQ